MPTKPLTLLDNKNDDNTAQTKSAFDKVVEWTKLVSVAGLSQIVVQVVGLVCGILVIRLLPTQEYALYTLSNAMLGTMLVLADGGISSGVMSLGGQVWQDRKKLGSVLHTGLSLRKRFALVSLPIAIAILLYLLRHHGASWLMSGLLVLSLIPAFFMALSGSLLEIVPKLHQNIYPLQRIQVVMNAGRLLLSGLSLFFFPVAAVAIIASGIPQIWSNIRLRKITAKYADLHEPFNAETERNIISVVKRILPGSIYYCLSGQITIWLISIFGSTQAVAQVGALGRLSVMISVFTVLFSTLIVPRFARMANDRRLLLNRYILAQVGFIALSVILVNVVWFFPAQVLWILGKGYVNLKYELVLSIAGSCLALIAGSSFSLSTSRGWVINPVISITVTVAAIIAGVVFIDISSLGGVLKFNIFVSSVEIVMYFVYCLIMIKNVKKLPVINPEITAPVNVKGEMVVERV